MNHKRKLAARILKTSPQKVKFPVASLEDIKKAITRSDLRGLIAVGKIIKSTPNEHSRARARKIAGQKRKGRRRGKGSHKGTKTSVVTGKEKWITRIRAQRSFLQELRGKNLLDSRQYQLLYSKCKGGYFRNKRHIKLYLTEHHLTEKKNPERKVGPN